MKKDDFPLLKNNPALVYLDNSATTQKPAVVIDAIKTFYETTNANVHRGIYSLSENATLLYQQAHEIVARFINASPKEIVFTKGTTESLNFLASSLGKQLQPGDEIVLTDMEHHSNIVPWQQIAKEKKLIVKFIPLAEDFRLDMDAARELITENTKIVSVTHMSNVLGTTNPVEELAEIAHQHDALFIVDAAQSVPHMPVDVQKINCDFMAFSAHKMCGPTGIGVLYGKKHLLENLEPSQYGGGMVTEVTRESASWTDVPSKLEAGTPNVAGAVGFMAAVQYLTEISMDKIEQHTHELTRYALQELSAIPNINIIGPRDSEDRGPVISFVLEGIHPHDISEILNRDTIAVRGGHHCAMPLMESRGINGTTRVSFYLYNTKEDVDRLITSLQKVITIFA